MILCYIGLSHYNKIILSYHTIHTIISYNIISYHHTLSYHIIVYTQLYTLSYHYIIIILYTHYHIIHTIISYTIYTLTHLLSTFHSTSIHGCDRETIFSSICAIICCIWQANISHIHRLRAYRLAHFVQHTIL